MRRRANIEMSASKTSPIARDMQPKTAQKLLRYV